MLSDRNLPDNNRDLIPIDILEEIYQFFTDPAQFETMLAELKARYPHFVDEPIVQILKSSGQIALEELYYAKEAIGEIFYEYANHGGASYEEFSQRLQVTREFLERTVSSFAQQCRELLNKS